MADLAVDIEKALQSAEEPMTVGELADALGVSVHDVDRVIWAEPDRFVWQPGHRWTLGSEKVRPASGRATVHEEAREGPLAPREPVQLRATTLASGITLKVSRKALDTHALFTVRSAGNSVDLILNSAHELFGTLPMPFAGEGEEGDFRRLAEVLLQAWALYEDSIPGGPSRRAAEDIRMLWGRRTLEMLRDGDAADR